MIQSSWFFKTSEKKSLIPQKFIALELIYTAKKTLSLLQTLLYSKTLKANKIVRGNSSVIFFLETMEYINNYQYYFYCETYNISRT